MSDQAKPPETLLAIQHKLGAHLRDPEHAAAPEGVEARRLAIYRRLFFNNLSNLFRRNFPVIRKLYDQAGWDALIRDFMVHQRPSTPMFTEIGSEFVQFLEDRLARGQGDPPWLVELAHWEYLETQARLDPSDPSDPAIDQHLDLRANTVVINPTLRLAQYQWPVHQIGPEFQPDQPAATWLAVWRRRDDEVRFMKINALTARLIETLATANPGSTTTDCLNQLAEEVGRPAPEVLAAGDQLLVSLHRRELVLGAVALAQAGQ
jgi:uncharacterized protein